MRDGGRRLAGCAVALVAVLCFPHRAAAEPTEPVVIGWWAYFDPVGTKTASGGDPRYPIGQFGDPDTYYYEPSGGHGLREDPAILPPDTAWKTMVDFVMARSSGVTLSATFTREEASDLNMFTETYFGWAFALVYIPKEKYCDKYLITLSAVDDGLQAMANAKICGYASLGLAQMIDLREYMTGNVVLRPGLNEVVVIHEDQAEVERYIRNFAVQHMGAPIPLAPKSIIVGRVSDAGTGDPLNEATVTLMDAAGMPLDAFMTGPLGFYFFAGLANGTYQVSAIAEGYTTNMASTTVALGAAATEVVTLDIGITPGCMCPDGAACTTPLDCLATCVKLDEFGETCPAADEVCVQVDTPTGKKGVCVSDLCDTLTCAKGFECKDGACVEVACGNVCCAAGEVCSAGLCVPNMCPAAGCGGGQVCAGGMCMDACALVTCVGGLTCTEGTCLEECEVFPERCMMQVPMAGSGTMPGGSTLGSGGASGASGKGGSGGDSGASGSDGSGVPRRRSTEPSGGCDVAFGAAEAPAGALWAAGLLAALGWLRVRRRGLPMMSTRGHA
jgi:hypothetical protein